MEYLSKTSETMTHIDFIKCYIDDNDYYNKQIVENLDNEDIYIYTIHPSFPFFRLYFILFNFSDGKSLAV